MSLRKCRIFLILISIVVGILAGLAAVALKTSVFFVQNLLHSSLKDYQNTYIFFIYPVIGLLLSTLYVQVFRKGELARGIGNVQIEISKNRWVVTDGEVDSQFLRAAVALPPARRVTVAALANKIGEKERRL